MGRAPERLLHDTLRTAAAAAPDKTALYADGAAYSYGQLLETAQRIGSALQERGLARGERVVLYLDNGFMCAAAIYGVLFAGGVFVVANPQTKAEKLSHMLRDSAAPFVITEARLAGELARATDAQPALRAILCQGSAGPGRELPRMESLESALRAAKPRARPVPTIPLDLAALIYTSGSTGAPKGVMMTHQSMLFTLGSLLEYLRLDANHRILNVLPLAFDYGLYQLLMSVGGGATLVLERSFIYPAKVLERMKQNEVTVFPGVPTIYAMLIGMHRKSPLRFDSVQRVTNTAATLPVDFLPALEVIFPNALIFKMYGLTECKRVAYLEPELLRERPTSVGKAIPGTEVFLLSPEGAPVPAGEPGILHVRGPHVMRGYLNQPDATARMLRPGDIPFEAVLCTGDWFRMDADGFLYFLGRSDDIIKSRGEKVSPAEVENCLYAMPGVREAAVVGVDDPVLGQAVRAVLAVEPDAGIDAQAVQKWCATHLENFMVPRDVIFLNNLPKGDTGKITKKGLAELPIPEGS